MQPIEASNEIYNTVENHRSTTIYSRRVLRYVEVYYLAIPVLENLLELNAFSLCVFGRLRIVTYTIVSTLRVNLRVRLYGRPS